MPRIPSHSQYFLLLDNSGTDVTSKSCPRSWGLPAGGGRPPSSLPEPADPSPSSSSITTNYQGASARKHFLHTSVFQSQLCPFSKDDIHRVRLRETRLGLPDLGSGPKVSAWADPWGLQQRGPPPSANTGTGVEFQSHVHLLSRAQQPWKSTNIPLALSFQCHSSVSGMCLWPAGGHGPLSVRLAAAHSPRQCSARLRNGSKHDLK